MVYKIKKKSDIPKELFKVISEMQTFGEVTISATGNGIFITVKDGLIFNIMDILICSHNMGYLSFMDPEGIHIFKSE